MATFKDFFAGLFRSKNQPVEVPLPEEVQAVPEGSFRGVDWVRGKTKFYGFLCPTCNHHIQTKDWSELRPADVFQFQHCGRQEQIRIADLDAAVNTLPAIRIEPKASRGVGVIPVGWQSNNDPNEELFSYEESDPSDPKDWEK